MAGGCSRYRLRCTSLEQEEGGVWPAAEIGAVIGLCKRNGRVSLSVAVGGWCECDAFLFYALMFGVLLTVSWLRFQAPLPQFLTLGLGKNRAVLVVMAALFAWVIYDFTSNTASEREAAAPPHQEGSQEIAAEGLKPGLRAPDFTLTDSEGREIKLSDYRGQTVLLNFWASWCPPCKVEMPYMQDFYEKHQDEDVIILAVNMTHLEKA